MSQAKPNQQPTAQPKTKAQAQPNDDADLLDEVLERTLVSMEKCQAKFVTKMDDPTVPDLRKAMLVGSGIMMMRSMMTEPVMKVLRNLMNTQIGFLTDRDPKKPGKGGAREPYDDDVLRDCAIEAVLKGLSWVGNQWNIIAGKLYITQDGYAHKLDGIPGLTWRPIPGIPEMKNGGCIARYGVEWELNGKKGKLTDLNGQDGIPFPIKMGDGATVDNILGKAMRKALKKAFESIKGIKSHEVDPDGDVAAVEEAIVNAQIASGDRISDKQVADLEAAIGEAGASAILIRNAYHLQPGERPLSIDFPKIMAAITKGDFSAPPVSTATWDGKQISPADGELPGSDFDDGSQGREWSAAEVEQAITAAGRDAKAICAVFGQKRIADLNQEARAKIMADCMGLLAGA